MSTEGLHTLYPVSQHVYTSRLGGNGVFTPGSGAAIAVFCHNINKGAGR
ncbi:MAG: hypothetical protein PHD06_11340 [Bacteroidales bacterium]|nr:hypothetical protein [Bacteroidales bacterium]